jgi:hypothetical protein
MANKRKKIWTSLLLIVPAMIHGVFPGPSHLLTSRRCMRLWNSARSTTEKCPSFCQHTSERPGSRVSEKEMEAVMQLRDAGPLSIPSMISSQMSKACRSLSPRAPSSLPPIPSLGYDARSSDGQLPE